MCRSRFNKDRANLIGIRDIQRHTANFNLGLRRSVRTTIISCQGGKPAESARTRWRPTKPRRRSRECERTHRLMTRGNLFRLSFDERRRSASTFHGSCLQTRCALSQPSFAFALAGFPRSGLDLGRTKEVGVYDDMIVAIQSHIFECDPAQFANRRGAARRDDIFVRLVLLKHQPHCLDIIPRMSQSAPDFDVAERQLRIRPSLMRATASVTLRVTNSIPRNGELVVEQDAACGVQAIAFTVVDGHAVRVELRAA